MQGMQSASVWVMYLQKPEYKNGVVVRLLQLMRMMLQIML